MKMSNGPQRFSRRFGFNRVVCVLLLLGIAQSATAVTYYVRATGKNSKDGLTPETAWKHISKAAKNAKAGDIVYVGAGTYKQKVKPKYSGTILTPIRYIADTSGAMTGDPGVVTIKQGGNHGIFVEDKTYLEFYGFEIDASKGVFWKNGDGGRLENCVIYDSKKSGIYVEGSTFTLQNCTIYGADDWGIEISNSSNVTVDQCEVHDCEEDGLKADGSSVNLTVHRSRFYQNDGHGAWLKKVNANVVNTILDLNEKNGIEIDDSSASVSVWHSTVVNNDESGIALTAGDISVRNSIVAFNEDYGLQHEGNSFVHTHNIVHGNEGSNFEGLSKDSTEMTSDPKFANVLATDYSLQSISPAIDSGTDASIVTNVDYDGKPRPLASGWDMGAFETSSSSMFTDVTDETGFGVQTTSGEQFGSGFHWADFDTDGDQDVIITGDSAYVMENLNQGAGFLAVSLGNVPRQGALVDLDNDGDIDFWASCVGSFDNERFFRNSGSGVFQNAGDAGFGSPIGNESCAAADIDADGWPEVVMFSENGNWIGLHQQNPVVQLVGTDQWVYGANDPGNADYFGNGDYCSSADVNNDGRVDFFYHYLNGKLFLSEGDGTYIMSLTSGIVVETGSAIKIGSAWGDYDNDGYLDLYVPHYEPSTLTPGYLWHNNQNGTFTNVNLNEAAGITNTNGQRGCCWGDYDNDGFLDLYITTRSGGNELYRNLGNGTFQLMFEGAGETGNNQDAAFIDYDNDGDLDLSITRQSPDTTVLLRNNLIETFGTNNYLKVYVRGTGDSGSNQAAIGTRVELRDSTGTTLIARRDIGGARGYAGGETLWVHFGGVDPNQTYEVWTYFQSGIKKLSVVPATVSTTIGATTIAQMVLFDEPPAVKRVIQWQEDNPIDP